MKAERVTTFRAKKVRDTPAALLVIDTATGAQFWVPKSLVADPDEPFADTDEEEITIPYWLAHKEGVA